MAPIPTSEKRPFIPAQGVMQAEMVFTFLGQTVENVFHVQQGDAATAPTLAEMTALATALGDWESSTGAPVRNAAAVLQEIVVRDLSSQNAPAIVRTAGMPIAGTGTGQPLPGNVTVAVKWSTAFRGRSFRGRTYHIGLQTSHISGDQLTGGMETTLTTAYTALRTAINAVAGCSMVVLSFAHNKFWRDAALATPVTQCSINIDLDSQRRRLAGRGS